MYKRVFGSAFLIAVLCLLMPSVSLAQAPRRTLSAQTKFFDASTNGETPGECSSTSAPVSSGTGGTTCYTKTVTVPPDSNTLLVDISATADVGTSPDQILEAVNLDGVPCVNGQNHEDGETGWVVVQSEAAPFTVNPMDSITTYQFCCHTTPGSHTVYFKIADESAEAGGATGVFLEQLTAVIDSAGPTDSSAKCGGI